MRNLIFIPPPQNEREVASTIRHEGIRVGEIIAYRAWRILGSTWLRRSDDRLHSVFMQDYIWHPGQRASGDVGKHGVYSFKNVIRSREQYGYTGTGGQLLFGSVKIWGGDR
jgi:hypothetical protein